MFVEEIVIDGFKSYAARTVIGPWDREFNAITGLNGSGKSNVLDAICFVLGISNLSQVRAQNLQDLVYKRGQAGITKASVSIVFNNEDKRQSPVGFEQCERITVTRQIVIGGKNKYLINGHLAQHQAIANLFQSVQLNINNPHFLIMQGRITKVLNMKPPEILAMIEEAAGTRMFEEKKGKALKTIQKKDQKLDEITSLMDNDIAPKLDKLKKEKADFLTFQKIEGEVERLRRLMVAYDYMKSKEKLNRSESDYADKQSMASALQLRCTDLESAITQIAADIELVLAQKERELKKSGQFQKLQDEVNEMANVLTRVNTQLGLKKRSVEEERESIQGQEANVEKLTSALAESESTYATMEKAFETSKAEIQQQTEVVKKQEEFLQTVSTGISGNEGRDNGYVDQIEAAKASKSTALTEIEQSKNRIVHIKDQLKTKQAAAKEAEKENRTNMEQYTKLEQGIVAIKAQREALGYDPKVEASMRQASNQKKDEIMRTQEQVDNLKAQLSNLDFRYTDPYVGFDRRKVKGLVAKLVKIDPSVMDYTTALQICAEGRLYYVVVDDNKVAADLLKNGKLKRKYTIIPLKQILAPDVDPRRIKRAHEIAPDRVHHALSLVGYEHEVEAAMKFTFGNTLICKDAEAAKAVAYHPDIKMRCITLDGDVYEPGATITGGSAPQSSDLLLRLSKLAELETKLAELKEEYAHVSEEATRFQRVVDQLKQLDAQGRKMEHEFTNLKNLMNESSAGQLLNEVQKMKDELVALQEKITVAEKTAKDADASVKTLEKEMREFATNRDGKIKKIEKEVAAAKADLSKRNIAFKGKQRELLTCRQDKEALEVELREASLLLESSGAALKALIIEEQTLAKEEASIKSQYETMNAELQKQSRLYVKFDKDLKRLDDARKEATENLNEVQIEYKRLVHEMERFSREKEAARESVEAMLVEFEWIAEQEENFGRANSAFDFTAQNPNECRKRLRQLEQEHDTLRKKINVKVMSMIDRVVTKERSLKQMLATVRKDKGKIEETIDQLDTYKQEALHKTWAQVNTDFGDIFNELLPGNTAKLEPPEGQSLPEGLEVKVCLGGVWKQSLTELSGGQRSLVALSLILSLLQFKPAPMYILDEIDAALDLSHTQNIGHLFKTRFKGSQFIVVSLKEGMFNNANVLFKARFRDGTSVVERFTQGRGVDATASPAPPKNKENVASNKSGAKKAAAATKRARRARPADDAEVFEVDA